MGMRGDWDGGWMQLVTRNSYTGTSYDGQLRFGGICGFFALGLFSLAHCAYRCESEKREARRDSRLGICACVCLHVPTTITTITYG